MPRNDAEPSRRARAARLSLPGRLAEGDELLVRSRQDYDPIIRRTSKTTKRITRAQHAGEWQPALSLFEYVQQSLVELCAGYIEASADKASDEGWEDYVRELGGELTGATSAIVTRASTRRWA